jgi:hypothetical protein
LLCNFESIRSNAKQIASLESQYKEMKSFRQSTPKRGVDADAAPKSPRQQQLSYFFVPVVLLQVFIIAGLNRHLSSSYDHSYSTTEKTSDLPSSNGVAVAASASAPSHPTCGSFFSVYSVAYIPGEQGKGSCETLYGTGRYTAVLERQSKQMVRLNSTLTIFTSWSENQLKSYSEKCRPSVNYTGITYKQFDPDSQLEKHNFTTQQIGWIKNWHSTAEKKGHVPARLADLWRILIAKENRMAYLDLDMFPAPPSSSIRDGTAADFYLNSPNVAVPIWSEELGAFEIQNSGFCFASNQLDYLIETLKEIIQSKGESQNYAFYTQLGPNIFQHAIQTLSMLAATKILYTTSNGDSSLKKVRDKADKYGKELYWFHLDGRFRGGNIGAENKLGRTFDEIFDNYDPKPFYKG